MYFQHELNQILKQIDDLDVYPSELIISLLDFTVLDLTIDEKRLDIFINKAKKYPVAGVCVYPAHLKKFADNSFSFKLITVANFPNSDENIKTTIVSLEKILKDNAPDEIDYVFPYRAYFGGNPQLAVDNCLQIRDFCSQNHLKLKIILETGAFNSPDILYEVAQKVIDTGCDFLKTSTGKIEVGATPLAAYVLLRAILNSNVSCGLKVSGGVKQVNQANLYMHLAQIVLNKSLNNNWFRIGASSLLDELICKCSPNGVNLRN